MTTALSLEKAKGSPNIWIPSGDCGWPAVQMFADMRTSHGLLASVAGQLLPLHHTDVLLTCARVSFSVCVRMWEHMAVLVCLFVCSRAIILTLKSHPSEELLSDIENKSYVSAAHMLYINVKHVNTICKDS